MLRDNYKNLQFYITSREIILLIYEATKQYPKEERGFTGIVSQLRRASISVVSNIAEGSSRGDKEHYHFLVISLGSLREIETQVGISYDLEYISKEKYNILKEKIDFSIGKLCSYMKVVGKDIFQKRNYK
jgi:four helix bundle protein